MKRNITEKRKNKYLIPTIVISVLLVIAVSLLLFVLYGNKPNVSVSKDNVIGNVNETSVAVAPVGARQYSGLLSKQTALPLAIMNNSDKVTMSWLNGHEAEREFSVSNMFPGDSVTKEYTLKGSFSKYQAVAFTTEITSGSNNMKLAEVLMIKVDFDSQEYYNGLLRDLERVVYVVPEERDVICTITVTLPAGREVDNSYAGQSLTAEFEWKLNRTVNPPVDGELGGGGGGGVLDHPVLLSDSTLKGTKTLSGREWKAGDSFTFILEYRTEENEYTKIAERTVTSPGEIIDFTDELEKFTFGRKLLYDFRITEVAGDIANVEYDSSVKTFQVLVGESGRGDYQLTAHSVVGNGVDVKYNSPTAYDLTFEFNNVYSSEPSVSIDDYELKLPVENEIHIGGGKDGEGAGEGNVGEGNVGEGNVGEGNIGEGNVGEGNIGEGNIGEGNVGSDDDVSKVVGDKEFIFVIENVETGEKQLVSVGNGETGYFDITYTKNDIGKTFKYEVYAFDDGEPGVEYSDKVYNLEVEVKRDASTNKIYVDMILDGVSVRPEDVVFKFSTTVTPEEKLDTILPFIILCAVLLTGEIIWLGCILYERYKKNKAHKEASGVKLNSLMAPVAFFSLLVPLWEVVVLAILILLVIVMFIVDIVLQIIMYLDGREKVVVDNKVERARRLKAKRVRSRRSKTRRNKSRKARRKRGGKR